VVLFQGAVEDPLNLELRGSHFESGVNDELNGVSSPLPSIVLDAMAAVEVIGTEELAKLISVSRSHGAGDPSAEGKNTSQ
jgi:hypothetical protein